ncbi:hypothetical protein IAE49_10795 [Kosakonia sp. S58]|uniref:hypothetical protein n=1 Tax=unclassified Kosakonia TaxID=2632876 RepID=UPI001906A1F3|nr:MULTISPECIES: hypothetical protein [unclassified Kosakonia]MBK0079768.1 hypothetical protein [Kosakonia sp. S57]MBK0086722.1 hypothetical protein [Kosakonia sp. S58]
MMRLGETEKISGELIRQAVMLLMDRNEDITLSSVLNILADFQMRASNTGQLNARIQAIADVRAAMSASLREESALKDKKVAWKCSNCRSSDTVTTLH